MENHETELVKNEEKNRNDSFTKNSKSVLVQKTKNQ